MANTNLSSRIILCNDETLAWGSSSKVLLKGEVALEILSGGGVKIKIGDGKSTFAQLKYATMTPEEISKAIEGAITTASHGHSNKAILDAITASFTTELKGNYDKAYTHSQAAHAPSNAERNIIAGVKKNGVAVNVGSDRTVDISVPTKVSQLTNDSNFATVDNTAAKTHTHVSGDITSLDASKLTGTIDIARLPHGAMERCVVVASDTERFKLTKTQVQTGDTVKVTATGKMYFVVDDAQLSIEAGYEVYTAGSATSVPWAGITGKPSTFTPSSHSHKANEVGLSNVTNDKQIKGLASGTTADHVVTFGADGYTVKDSGFTIGKSVPSNAVFTDTKYSVATASVAGLVKSATGTNKVQVAGDGAMSVSAISTDILANGTNTLILNGGGAN